MKKLILTLTIVLAAINARAESDVSKQKDVINSQVRITHDTLEQVLSKMRNAPGTNEVYNNPDFVLAAKRFNDLAEQAMIQFEKTLKEEILPQVSLLVNRLNSIESSTLYNPDQKTELFNQQKQLANQKMVELSKIYQTAVEKLYAMGLPEATATHHHNCPFIGAYGKEFYEIRFQDSKLKNPDRLWANNPYCGNDSKKLSWEAFAYRLDFAQLTRVVFQQSILNQCLSQSCVALLGNHRKNYLNEISKYIDKSIGFRLVREEEYLQLSELAGNSDNVIVQNISKHFNALPNEITGLPFDISPADFERMSKGK